MSRRRYLSPLRYPGGKASVAPWLAEVAGRCGTEIWVEPFAGGAGAGLALLEEKVVDEIWLVDAHPGIAAIWQTITSTDGGPRLAERIERTTPSLALYDEMLETITSGAAAGLDLAYAAFIVNRLSSSGIIAPRTGVMGGRGQTGPVKLDDRYNGPALAERVRYLWGMRHRVRAVHGDGIAHIEELAGSGLEDEVLVFADPPYVREGSRLYANSFGTAEHQRLANALNACPSPWLLTYDNESVIRDELYAERRVYEYAIRNTAGRARTATEYAIASDNLDPALDEVALCM